MLRGGSSFCPVSRSPLFWPPVLSRVPLDDFAPDPAQVMQVVGDPEAMPPAVREFALLLAAYGVRPAALERHAFYGAASGAFVVLQTGERRLYGNILLRKGVTPLEAD